MEAIKGFIFDNGKVEILGTKTKANKYLVSFVLITEKEIPVIKDGETIIMGNSMLNVITGELSRMKKYKPPNPLGDASNAIISVSNMSPKDLEPYDKK